MRILGIDPGLENTGWGMIDVAGSRLSYVACGIIKTKKTDPIDRRLVQIERDLTAIIEQYKPDQSAIEETFVNKNAGSSLKLGMARGVAMLIPARSGITVAEYGANKVKKSVVGAGHADKAQIVHMVKMLLPASGGAVADAADALAVAICHAHHAQSNIMIRKAVEQN